jgi:hypothetical protein
MNQIATLRELFGPDGPQVSFTRRPEAIPGDLRIAWRLTTLCLILSRTWGGKSNLATMNVLWWAIRSAEARELFLRWVRGEQSPEEVLVRYDPSFSATLDFAVGQGLVVVDEKFVIQLSKEGTKLAQTIWNTSEVLEEEKTFLQALPSRITQKSVKELVEWP